MSGTNAKEASAVSKAPPVIREFDVLPGLHEAVSGTVMRWALRTFFRPIMKPPTPVPLQRATLHVLSAVMPGCSGVKVDKTRVGDMHAERIRPKGSEPRQAILYLHGGAFIAGSPRSHRSITTRLAKFADAEVLAIHYRRVPEHPFPAQIDDAVTGYRQLLSDGYQPSQIAVAGDSAGGTLTLLLYGALRLQGLPLPKCLVMLSPAFDGNLNGPSVQRYRDTDPMINLEWGHQGFGWYAPQPGHPLAFPKELDLAMLPPTLVQVGEHEILYDDSVWLTHAASHLDRRVDLEVYKERWHVFQIFGALMPSALLALQRQAAFMKQQWSGSPERVG